MRMPVTAGPDRGAGMTRGRGRSLHIAVTFDVDEVRTLLERGRSARSLAALYGMSVLSLQRKVERAGDDRLALLISREVTG